MSTQPPTEEELRAAYEEQIRQVRVEHVLLDNVVMLVNLGMRRAGLVPGTESERDPEQVRLSIEAVRALMPLLETAAPDQVRPVREALSQLQLAYLQIGGTGAAAAAEPGGGPAEPESGSGTPQTEPASSKPPASKPGEAGPAQRSGRLWVPGQ